MSLVPSGIGKASNYPIKNSLRFRSSASAYLNRTLASNSTSNTTLTFSAWIKRGTLPAARQVIFYGGNGAGSGNLCSIEWRSNSLGIVFDGGGTYIPTTNALFRDISSWLHLHVMVNTTSSNSATRCLIYINGIQQTTTGTQPPLNHTMSLGSGNVHTVGNAASNYFDGCLAEVNFIDGQALDVNRFGYIDSYTGEWIPKKYTGTYGTNGFYLPFRDGSSLSNLAADFSGNGNNFTTNNISITAGINYDWMNDTPTNNFCVLNPLDVTFGTGVVNTLRDGNLFSTAPVAQGVSLGTFWLTSGKYYFESTRGAVGTILSANYVGIRTTATAYYAADGSVGGVSGSAGATYTTNDIIGVAIDKDAGTIEFFKNGTSQGGSRTITTPSGDFTPIVSGYNGGIFYTNFGQRPFSYSPPTGFKSLNTSALLTPTITNPAQYFQTYLYQGNAAGQQIGEIQRSYETYSVQRSLRFKTATSSYLTRTPGAGNRRTWTWSGWVKRGTIGTGIGQTLFGRDQGASGQNFAQINFDTSDRLNFINYTTSTDNVKTTTLVFKDVSVFNHIVCIFDSTNATAADRIRLYVNGERQTSFASSTDPTLNYDGYINQSGIQHCIGSILVTSRVNYFDGYLAEVNFVDGSAVLPSSFGQTDGNGYWVPKAYTGGYGTNGFYLPFSNTTSLSTLTADSSGNGNNFTANNVSLTAGVTYDSMIDVPGNSYATINPADGSQYSGFVPSSTAGNLFLTSTSASSSNILATMYIPTTGKYYFEYRAGAIGSPGTLFSWVGAQAISGFTGTGIAYSSSGTISFNGASTSGYATFTLNDIIGVAIDRSANTASFYKNGTLIATGTFGNPDLVYKPWFQFNNNGDTAWVNFGQQPFIQTPPTGYVSLSENNIIETSGDIDYPGIVWIKNRSSASNHALFDRTRGATIYSSSNVAGTETTDVNSVQQFNKNGVLIGNSSIINTSGNNYVSWMWRTTGEAPVTNTNGSVTSQVSANVKAGVSAVTWNTPASGNYTIGHGLSTAPKMVIVKGRADANHWLVGHDSIGWTNFLLLSINNAASTAARFNNTAPTSTVFTLGGSFYTTGAGAGPTYFAYCFSEVSGFSKFGGYTGNGSADGPFIYTGFKPAYLLVKSSTEVLDWWAYDNARNPQNLGTPNLLRPNLNNAEVTQGYADFLSNGFKIRNTGNNTNGQSYIYAAFAESPFKFARAR